MYLRKKSKKLAKLEKERWSIFTDNEDLCYICYMQGKEVPAVNKHEILYGSNRRNSMLYGYVLPVCAKCHRAFHDNHVLTRLWAKQCQKYHEKNYGVGSWMDTFHRNYL